jgi:hypothetical protein
VSKPAVGYWRLGESGGTQAVNEMGAPAGTYVGSPTLGVASGFENGSDTAVDFSGPGDYVTVPDAAALRLTNSFAIELWVKSNQLGQHGTLLNRNGRYLVQYGFGTQADSVEFAAVAYSGTCDPHAGARSCSATPRGTTSPTPTIARRRSGPATRTGARYSRSSATSC